MTQRNRSAAGRSGDNRPEESAEQKLPAQITVLMIDAHPWTREALAQALESVAPYLEVLRFADAREVAPLQPVQVPALALVNVSGMPLYDERLMSAVETLQSRQADLPIVALSEGADGEEILRAIERGLSGYIPLSLDLQLAVEALRFVAAGGTYVPAESVLASFVEKAGPDELSGHSISDVMTEAGDTHTLASLLEGLTPRERAVLGPLCQGKSNKQIAREVGMREATVKVHVRHIMRKLGVTNRTQVALLVDLLPKS